MSYANKWGAEDDDDMAFNMGNMQNNQYLDPKKLEAKKNNALMDGMSAGQMEVFSVVMSKIRHEEKSEYHYYWCFFLLILISVVNTFQRSTISFMFTYAANEEKMYDSHYSIRDDLTDFSVDNYNLLVGDSFTIIYAFMVLFTGSASDLFNRRLLLCGSCFGWCTCMYLSSFSMNF